MLTKALESSDANYRRDLGDGLLLRWSTPQDTEQIVQQVGHVFRDKADEPPNKSLQTVVRHMMHGNFPLTGPGDYALVEDTRRQDGNSIVAGVSLWRQPFDYDGINFEMGRPEIVFTDPAYRNRGLIRALFEIVHARSAREGHLVQGITGIPYFYRQFGYEYALDLGGMRGTYLSSIPRAREGEQELLQIQEAASTDIPLIQQLYTQRRTRTQSIVWTHILDDHWRYQLEDWKQHGSEERYTSIQMIIDTQGEKIGYAYLRAKRRDKVMYIWDLETAQGTNLYAIMPALLRTLQAYGLQMPTSEGEKVEPLSEIHFILGRTHPIYNVLGNELAPKEEQPYCWYVRVPDLARFLTHISPALEQRLAVSEVAGYTGELKLDFYSGGLKLIFAQGKLKSAENWRVPPFNSEAQGGFPPLLFLQVVFGHRSVEELRTIYPDVWIDQQGRLLLNTLFPTRHSAVMPFL
jgi:GNAT superfamily N-acetyltransferase